MKFGKMIIAGAVALAAAFSTRAQTTTYDWVDNATGAYGYGTLTVDTSNDGGSPPTCLYVLESFTGVFGPGGSDPIAFFRAPLRCPHSQPGEAYWETGFA
jgi:hypothetical protein